VIARLDRTRNFLNTVDDLCGIIRVVAALSHSWKGNVMTVFEYKCVCIVGAGERTTRLLNSYGLEGWELVCTCLFWHYFKRPAQ
jgi:hypothetical protein